MSQLKIAYYDWLDHIDDYLPKDGRIHSRLEEGLSQLRPESAAQKSYLAY